MVNPWTFLWPYAVLLAVVVPVVIYADKVGTRWLVATCTLTWVLLVLLTFGKFGLETGVVDNAVGLLVLMVPAVGIGAVVRATAGTKIHYLVRATMAFAVGVGGLLLAVFVGFGLVCALGGGCL